jgi:hypothetical protein
MISRKALSFTKHVAQSLPSYFCDDADDVIVGLCHLGFLLGENNFWIAGPDRVRPGDFLRDLFFEEIEEDKLSMKKFSKLVLIAAAAALSPSSLFACATCYGKSDAPLAHGMNWGIFTLLGIVVLMLSSIATFFVFIIRREAALQAKKMTEENLSGAQI